MSFKELVEADSKSVFLNGNEFADLHTIRFDSNEYADIPLVITKIKQSDRVVVQSDHMQGIFLVSEKVYFNLEDTDGNIPEQGKMFEIDEGVALGRPFFQRYNVITVENAMGMICVELEALDE